MRHRSLYSLPMAGLLCLLIAMLSACAASAPDNDAQASQSAPPTAAAEPSGQRSDTGQPPVQAPPMSDPLPPERLPAPDPDRAAQVNPPSAAGAPVQLDFSCTSDADCAVKNVGNCCGYYPKCVNQDSPTDPDAVQAQCAKSGMASVCGFPAITACQCVRGSCESSDGALIPIPQP